ncbi:hypothetical protein [Streptomyces enissocaesilis]|uniref:alpha/beta fold hydrolase n=1 Tax=Streptomyces enissocaesilis TaxID=332589 RepID=UPI0031E257AD
MVATAAENAERDFWAEWNRIRCPTLVVLGAQGWMPEAEAAEMRTRRRCPPAPRSSRTRPTTYTWTTPGPSTRP